MQFGGKNYDGGDFEQHVNNLRGTMFYVCQVGHNYFLSSIKYFLAKSDFMSINLYDIGLWSLAA